MMKLYGLATGIVLMLMLTACDSDSGSTQRLQTPAGPAVKRTNNPALVLQGQTLYKQHCVQCHGVNAEGDALWRKPDAQGYYPPPPLNGSGHTWHHPRATLHAMIKQGSPVDEQGRPQGRMPAWGRALDDEQIEALIAWFQSLWPDPVYAIWYDREQRARGEHN